MKWLKKGLLILSIPAFLIMLVVIGFLYPGWAYAKQTDYQAFTIYHDTRLEEGWDELLDGVGERLLKTGIHEESLRFNICLKDGSVYPDIIEAVAGESFAFAGVNVIILQSQPNVLTGVATRGELIYDLTTLLTHEAVHCQEYRHQGFWGSNPLAGHPTWKWEGFAELTGRGSEFLQDSQQVTQLWRAASEGGWVNLEDGTMVHSSYLRFALLSKLCLDANDGDFDRFLADQRPDSFWRVEMEKLL